ncbi:MAG: hypothetical protein QOD99_2537 [Chthoniobacter sp.]|nr:hypothetical protein [Chthoniobacter sp.]
MIGNGLFFRDLRKVLFWEQSAALVEGERIWKNFRASGKRVGMMFWQQSLGEELDLVLSPAPIHKHSGGMIQDCYSKPRDLYGRLKKAIGRPFNLMNYWGPLASRKSSDWIVDATCAVMRMRDAPDLLFSYIPHLDYDLQRYGPESPQAAVARGVLLSYLQKLRATAAEHDFEVLFYGDYAIEPVTRGALFPNRRLRGAGLMSQRSVKQMGYADFFASDAFAMVDHQVAHIFTSGETATADAREALAKLVGVDAVLGRQEQLVRSVLHPRGGDLLLVAEPGAWFAYPWWREKREAPDFATHVDIHNKPGYDPCELFFGWPPISVSTDTTRIRGTHGRADGMAAWSSSLDFPAHPDSLLALARLTKVWLDRQA